MPKGFPKFPLGTGKRETSAPVSIKKTRPEFRSVTKRRKEEAPSSPVSETLGLTRFLKVELKVTQVSCPEELHSILLSKYILLHNTWLFHQNYGGKNKANPKFY